MMPLRLVLADATMIGGGLTEIAMMMIAPSATHGSGSGLPRSVLDSRCRRLIVRHRDSVPYERSGRTIYEGQGRAVRRASRTISDRRGIATARGTPSGFDLGGGDEAFIHSSQLRTSRLSRPPTEKENPSNFLFLPRKPVSNKY